METISTHFPHHYRAKLWLTASNEHSDHRVVDMLTHSATQKSPPVVSFCAVLALFVRIGPLTALCIFVAAAAPRYLIIMLRIRTLLSLAALAVLLCALSAGGRRRVRVAGAAAAAPQG